MNDYRQRLGSFGEKIVEKYLSRYGYAVLERNFKTYYGEIDLIVQKDDEILFCEVKTRTGSDFGYPEEAVGRRKIKRLLLAAGLYRQWKGVEKFWRLDIFSVEINKIDKKAKICWFRNISEDF